jgi:carbon storage regulator
MLVMRRRVGEGLLIGHGIEIEILEQGGGQVKLGIKAPRSIPIVRREILHTRLQNEKAAALPSSFTGIVQSSLTIFSHTPPTRSDESN